MFPKSVMLALIMVSISYLQQMCHGSQRMDVGFQEKVDTSPNSTFDCSPSGPCLPCQYSEKSEDKYCCSETGYRIPFKCTGDVKKETGSKRGPPVSDNAAAKDVASRQEVGRHEYVTYRSCTQDVNQEKLSVLGFEVLVLGLLLVSGSFVVLRRKKTVALAGTGGVRLQSNPRF